MIEKEYGKEKKKHIYETMYSELSGGGTIATLDHMQNSSFMTVPNIKLNLRKEINPVPQRQRRSQHVKLKTISARGDIEEKLIQIDQNNAEKMNTTMNSSSFAMTSANFGDSTMRRSASKFNAPPQISEKQFYLFSPSKVQLTAKAKSRYDHSTDEKREKIESQPSQPSQPSQLPTNASIINL